MLGCAVPMCINNTPTVAKRNGVKFYAFPKDPVLLKAWMKALDFKNFQVKDKKQICSEHFPEESFYVTKRERKMYDTALPTIRIVATESASFKTCRICLTQNTKMYNVREFSQAFEQITSISASEGESRRLPQMLCWECAARLTAAASFRAKALLSDGLLRDLLRPDVFIKIRDIRKVNRKHYGLKTSLVQRLFDSDHFDVKINDTFAGPDNETEIFDNNDSDPELTEALEHDEVVMEDVTESDKKFTLQLEHNYSNIDNTEDNTTAENNNDYIDHSVFNETVEDTADDVLEETLDDVENLHPEKEKEGKRKGHVGNWNIEVKSSNTISIVPLDLVAVKEEAKQLIKNAKKHKVKIPKDAEPPSKTKKVITGACDRPPMKDVDKDLFEIIPLTYEQQASEIEKRKESEAYINAPHKCDVCYMSFKNRGVYERHALKHTDYCGSFECFICKVRKKRRSALTRHLAEQHTREYRCRKCMFFTRHRQTAVGHMDFHAGHRYTCEQCSSVFDRHTSYLGHLRLAHMTDLVCNLCGYTYISRHGVMAHKARQHRLDQDKELVGPFCEECDCKFLSQEAYDRHLRLSSKHVSDEQDPLRIRNEPGKTRPIVRIRRPVYVGPKKKRPEMPQDTTADKIICELCGKEVCNYSAYSLHFIHAHPGQSRGQHAVAKSHLMCDQCGKMFRSKQGLDSHQWVHTGEKLYQCDLCGKNFCHKVSLTAHIQSKHIDKEPANKCELCDKTFTLQNNLKKHLKIHLGVKRFQCEICSKKFTTSDSFQSHVRHVHFKIPWKKRHRKIVKREAEE